MVKYNEEMETRAGNIGNGLEMFYRSDNESGNEFFTSTYTGGKGINLKAVDEDERGDIIDKGIFD